MDRRKKRLVIGLVLLMIVFLSMGYSAFNTELSITGIVSEIRPTQQIRITSLAVEEVTSNAETTYTDYNKDRMIVGIKLPEKTSSVKYKVEVTNIGDIEMGIASLDNLPESLTYELEGYNLKDKLCNSNNECSLGITKEFYITIKYKDTSSVSSNIYDINLIFNFNQYYSVSYSNIKVLSPVCKPVNADNLTVGTLATTQYNPGEEYTCEVKDGLSYNFFVLSTEGETVNFLMNGLVGSDGSLATGTSTKSNPYNGSYTLVQWISEEDYGCGALGSACADTAKGPITAINFLNNATADWNNVNTINESYTDENDGVYGTIALTGKARLPKLSEFQNTTVGCTTDYGSCPAWAINYLANNYNYEGVTAISGMYGFWLLPSKYNVNTYGIYAWHVGSSGNLGGSTIYLDSIHGVKPVINVSKVTPEVAGKQTTIIGSDTFVMDFNADAPSSITVTMNGVAVADYTYTNGVLTIPNVIGNIEVIGN